MSAKSYHRLVIVRAKPESISSGVPRVALRCFAALSMTEDFRSELPDAFASTSIYLARLSSRFHKQTEAATTVMATIAVATIVKAS